MVTYHRSLSLYLYASWSSSSFALLCLACSTAPPAGGSVGPSLLNTLYMRVCALCFESPTIRIPFNKREISARESKLKLSACTPFMLSAGSKSGQIELEKLAQIVLPASRAVLASNKKRMAKYGTRWGMFLEGREELALQLRSLWAPSLSHARLWPSKQTLACTKPPRTFRN